MVFTTVFRILVLFDLSKVHDQDGNHITPVAEFTSGTIKSVLPIDRMFNSNAKSQCTFALFV